MADSILASTKKLLGIAEDYAAFDTDVITFINSALGTLHQLNVGPVDGLAITDITTDWDALAESVPVTNLARTYVYLKTRMGFDPPTARFPIQALEEQLKEMEWRIHVMVEASDPAQTIAVVEPIRPVPAGPDPNEEAWWALLP